MVRIRVNNAATANKNRKNKKKGTPPDDGEERYTVEGLRAMRIDPISKKRQVLVQWKDYPISESTWEPYEMLKEDGFIEELRALFPASLEKNRYLFVVRLSNTCAAGPGLYKRLRSFVASQSNDSKAVLHMPGNVHFILYLAPSELSAFTASFRRWLAGNAPVQCAHASLWKLATISQICVYPNLDK